MNQKFAVFKASDIENLSSQEKIALCHIAESIEENRINEGKTPFNSYMVINIDEPYAGEVMEILRRHGHWDDEPESEGCSTGLDGWCSVHNDCPLSVNRLG